jgi:hypothetical protein
MRIDPQDFESGAAHWDGGYAYCANCAPGVSPTRWTAGRKRPIESRKVAKKRYGLSRIKTRKERRFDEYEDNVPETVAHPRKSPAFLIGVIAVAAVFVVIIVAIAVSNRRSSQRGPALFEEESAPEPRVAAKPKIEEPPAPVVPEKTPGEKRLEDALSYARAHPKEFDKIVDMLEAIERDEMVSDEVGARIDRYIAEFMGLWDAAAKEMWEKTQQQASTAEKSGDIAKAISAYESVPEVCVKLPAYAAKVKEELGRLKIVQEAKEEFAQIEPLLSEIDSDKGLEELKKMREQIAAFSAKYESTEYARTLKEPLAKLDEIIAPLERKAEEEEQKKREEEDRKRQAELAKQEAEKRAKEWQEQKAHIEKFWAQNNFDSTALPERQVGKEYRLFNGADTNGWLMAGTKECDWGVQNGEIVGSNRSASQSGLLITNYKRQYFWENYTFECKACISRGTGALIVRANVDENNRFTGTIYRISQNQWISIKVVVKDDQVDISVDGGQPETYRSITWHAGFVGLVVEPGGEAKFKDLILHLDSVKPAVR